MHKCLTSVSVDKHIGFYITENTPVGAVLLGKSFVKKQRTHHNMAISKGTWTFDDLRTCDGCAAVGWVGGEHKVGTGTFHEAKGKGAKGKDSAPRQRKKRCGTYRNELTTPEKVKYRAFLAGDSDWMGDHQQLV
jgi:hypothetical protein